MYIYSLGTFYLQNTVHFHNQCRSNAHMHASYAENRDPLTKNARSNEGVIPEYSPFIPDVSSNLFPTENAESCLIVGLWP